MKKLYITFTILLVLGIGSGIYYFGEYRQSNMAFPEDIVMTEQTGSEYSFGNLAPKIRLLEFVYTTCPDICPSTTFQMQKVRDRLKKDGVFGSRVEFLTVTIDPSHDTEQILSQYAALFKADQDDGWKFLRGSEADTQKLADQFNFQYREAGADNFVHTSTAYLIDEKNEIIKLFGMGNDNFDQDKVYKQIKKELD